MRLIRIVYSQKAIEFKTGSSNPYKEVMILKEAFINPEQVASIETFPEEKHGTKIIMHNGEQFSDDRPLMEFYSELTNDSIGKAKNYIIAWMDMKNDDHYEVFLGSEFSSQEETFSQARGRYVELTSSDECYSANICTVILSTDY